MKLLGIDFGRRFVGLARASVPPGLPEPWQVLPVKGREDALLRLTKIIRDEHVDRIVVGLPLDDDGRAGSHAKRLRRIGTALSRVSGVDVAFVDEHGTSEEARAFVARDDRADAHAAALILTRYLDTDWQASC